MRISAALPRTPDLFTLQTLLSTLCADAVLVLGAAPPGIDCYCAPEDAPRLEGGLRERLNESAGFRHDTATEPGLHTMADAVLTLVQETGEPLPRELAATLTSWQLAPRAIRRRTFPGGETLSLEFFCDGWSRCQEHLSGIQALADRWGVDLALAPADSKRPRRRLVAFDMDSTLIQCEVIDELARRAGVGDEVAAVTARAMRGELDFRSSFRERMGRLRGLSAAALEAVAAELPLMPGAEILLPSLRAQGHYTVILSGGFDYFALRLQQRLGLDEVHANHLHIVDGQLTGEVEGEIIDGERKALLLHEVAAAHDIAMEDTVAVGDGANDLLMLGAAGMGVAFHAKPLVREKARYAMMHADLAGLLAVLGIPAIARR